MRESDRVTHLAIGECFEVPLVDSTDGPEAPLVKRKAMGQCQSLLCYTGGTPIAVAV